MNKSNAINLMSLPYSYCTISSLAFALSWSTCGFRNQLVVI